MKQGTILRIVKVRRIASWADGYSSIGAMIWLFAGGIGDGELIPKWRLCSMVVAEGRTTLACWIRDC